MANQNLFKVKKFNLETGDEDLLFVDNMIIIEINKSKYTIMLTTKGHLNINKHDNTTAPLTILPKAGNAIEIS